MGQFIRKSLLIFLSFGMMACSAIGKRFSYRIEIDEAHPIEGVSLEKNKFGDQVSMRSKVSEKEIYISTNSIFNAAYLVGPILPVLPVFFFPGFGYRSAEQRQDRIEIVYCVLKADPRREKFKQAPAPRLSLPDGRLFEALKSEDKETCRRFYYEPLILETPQFSISAIEFSERGAKEVIVPALQFQFTSEMNNVWLEKMAP